MMIELEDAIWMIEDNDPDSHCRRLADTIHENYPYTMVLQVSFSSTEDLLSDRIKHFSKTFGQPLLHGDGYRYRTLVGGNPSERWTWSVFGLSFTHACTFFVAGFKTESDFVMFRLSI